ATRRIKGRARAVSGDLLDGYPWRLGRLRRLVKFTIVNVEGLAAVGVPGIKIGGRVVSIFRRREVKIVSARGEVANYIVRVAQHSGVLSLNAINRRAGRTGNLRREIALPV